MCELALYDVDGRRLAVEQLRPDEAERVVRAGIDNGFLTETTDVRLEMHPLLRAFLDQKLKEKSPKVSGASWRELSTTSSNTSCGTRRSI